MNINDALISSAITSGIYILYKGINHYRIHSTCNSNNELVISVIDIEALSAPTVQVALPEKQPEKPKENTEMSIVVNNP